MSSHIFNPKSKEPFKISRSKLELFLQCPKCFYLDLRFGVKRPGSMPFTLNNAVDFLLKKEFDIFRAKDKSHPLMKAYRIKAVPFAHVDIDEWRYNFTGVQFLHAPTNLLVFGAVDDIWIGTDNQLIVVDYKATSINKPITLDDPYRQAYKRQMEIYQWLLRRKGFKVSKTGYFVYCNAKTDREAFDAKLEFDVQIIPYTGNDSWVESAVIKSHKCLKSSKIPKASEQCEFCDYVEKAGKRNSRLAI